MVKKSQSRAYTLRQIVRDTDQNRLSNILREKSGVANTALSP